MGAPILSRAEPRRGLSVRFSHGKVTVSDGAPLEAETGFARFIDALPGVYEDVIIGLGDICLVHSRQVIQGRSGTRLGVGRQTRWLLLSYS